MKNNKIRLCGMALVALVWAALTLGAWFGPDHEVSTAERRTLAQMPEITVKNVLDGSFMEKFEDYTLDQFPLRDGFRTVKSLSHYYLLGHSDNNGIYIHNGHAAQQEYPLDYASLDRAAIRFTSVYNTYLAEGAGNVYMVVVPDKGCFLASEAGQLHLDYDEMYDYLVAAMPWAQFIDITPSLRIDSYYRTDTHWRQEMLPDVAALICGEMGVSGPTLPLTATALEQPFYGVYYGQAAVPMTPDTLYLLENEVIANCVTYTGSWDAKNNTGAFVKRYDGVYDMSKAEGDDLYEIYLSGSESLLRIENPNAATDRELIVFRDSFGSSIIPLLLQDYAAVTVIDIRYIQPATLAYFPIDWDADVLFLYSTLVLNNSETIK